MPEPDCFLRYRLRCYAEFYVGKIPRIRIGVPPLQQGVVLNGFIHSAVGTLLSEVHALYRVSF